MGLLAELGIAPDQGVNIGDVEKDMASGGLCPEGIHQAVVDSVGDLVIEGEKRGDKIKFLVIAGPGKDSIVEDTVWLPAGNDDTKDKRSRNRRLLFAHRLGLLKKVTKNGIEMAVEVEGKTGFCDCLGAPCWIDVKHEEEEYEKDGRKKKVMKAKLTFEGVVSPEDKRVKGLPTGKAPAASGGGSSGGGSATTKAAAAKKDDFAGL